VLIAKHSHLVNMRFITPVHHVLIFLRLRIGLILVGTLIVEVQSKKPKIIIQMLMVAIIAVGNVILGNLQDCGHMFCIGNNCMFVV
jgi:hypothetical protein